MNTPQGPRIARWDEIRKALSEIDVIAAMERGFMAYSAGRCVVPPVGELSFDEPRGDVHIKYGYVRGEELYVVKIASGFYQNPARGLPSSDGLMLLFWQATGEQAAILLDAGRLTDIRTAAAGAVAAKYLAHPGVQRIGVLGTGTQARVQLEYLRRVTDCTDAIAWGRDTEHLASLRDDAVAMGYRDFATTTDAREIAASCGLIVTTTPSMEPLLEAPWIRPGTHITAVGSDAPGKRELDAALLGRADLVVADSIGQCRERGEIAHAVAAGVLDLASVSELGEVIAGKAPGRQAVEQITIADLTGVAVQDVAIASAVFRALDRTADTDPE